MPGGRTTALTPKAVTPRARRTWRKPGPSPSRRACRPPSRLRSAHPDLLCDRGGTTLARDNAPGGSTSAMVGDMSDSSSSSLRSVKIGSDERTGWSSERPRREGEPERPAPRRRRARAAASSPRTDRLRYAPGSLLLVVGADTPAERGASPAASSRSPARCCRWPRSAPCCRGASPPRSSRPKASALLDATAAKRLAAGDSVVDPGRGPRPRDARALRAHGPCAPAPAPSASSSRRARIGPGGRPRHAARPAQRARRRGPRRGGFFTALRLGGNTIREFEEDRLRAAALRRLTPLKEIRGAPDPASARRTRRPGPRPRPTREFGARADSQGRPPRAGFSQAVFRLFESAVAVDDVLAVAHRRAHAADVDRVRARPQSTVARRCGQAKNDVVARPPASTALRPAAAQADLVVAGAARDRLSRAPPCR